MLTWTGRLEVPLGGYRGDSAAIWQHVDKIRLTDDHLVVRGNKIRYLRWRLLLLTGRLVYHLRHLHRLRCGRESREQVWLGDKDTVLLAFSTVLIDSPGLSGSAGKGERREQLRVELSWAGRNPTGAILIHKNSSDAA